jgi:hypothetical protein
VPDVGDVTVPTLTVAGGDVTTTATLTVYKPDGDTDNPIPTTADVGLTWTVPAVTYTLSGWWAFEWTTAGAGAGAETQRVFVGPVQPLPPNIPPIYATLDELKARVGGVAGSSEDDALTNALMAASRGIDLWCKRRFYRDDVATARVFQPVSPRVAFVDDFWTTDGLIIATGEGDDTFATTWTSAERQLEPLNGIVDGVAGWPYWRIRSRGGSTYSLGSTGDVTLQVTAKWGWAAVPANVSEACRIIAEEIYKLKDAPFGVAGFGDLGVVRIRENPKVAAMLFRYQRDGVKVA